MAYSISSSAMLQTPTAYLKPNPNFLAGFGTLSEGSIGETGDLDRDRSFSLASQPAEGAVLTLWTGSLCLGFVESAPRSTSLTPYTVPWRRLPPRGVGGGPLRPVRRREARLRVSRMVHDRRLAMNHRLHIATVERSVIQFLLQELVPVSSSKHR